MTAIGLQPSSHLAVPGPASPRPGDLLFAPEAPDSCAAVLGGGKEGGDDWGCVDSMACAMVLPQTSWRLCLFRCVPGPPAGPA
eukprot:7840187-Pyramimonas_sp.AAC.1